MLKNYIKIWEIVSSLIGEEFDSKVYYGDNNKYINTKIKMKVKYTPTFMVKEFQKNTPHKCLSLIMLDYVSRINNKIISPNILGRV